MWDLPSLVAAELAGVRIPGLHELAAPLFIPPKGQLREWQFKLHGQKFDCWLIAISPDGKWGMAYGEFKHAGLWGVVQAQSPWLGNEDDWFVRFEDAFIRFCWNVELAAADEENK